MTTIPWTQIILGINGALISASTGIVLLDVSDAVKAVVVFGCSIGLAFISPFITKTSAAVRRTLNLRRGG